MSNLDINSYLPIYQNDDGNWEINPTSLGVMASTTLGTGFVIKYEHDRQLSANAAWFTKNPHPIALYVNPKACGGGALKERDLAIQRLKTWMTPDQFEKYVKVFDATDHGQRIQALKTFLTENANTELASLTGDGSVQFLKGVMENTPTLLERGGTAQDLRKGTIGSKLYALLDHTFNFGGIGRRLREGVVVNYYPQVLTVTTADNTQQVHNVMHTYATRAGVRAWELHGQYSETLGTNKVFRLLAYGPAILKAWLEHLLSPNRKQPLIQATAVSYDVSLLQAGTNPTTGLVRSFALGTWLTDLPRIVVNWLSGRITPTRKIGLATEELLIPTAEKPLAQTFETPQRYLTDGDAHPSWITSATMQKAEQPVKLIVDPGSTYAKLSEGAVRLSPLSRVSHGAEIAVHKLSQLLHLGGGSGSAGLLLGGAIAGLAAYYASDTTDSGTALAA